MTIRFQVGGVNTAIPGVYDTFRVENSLPAPVPAGRSVLILGEAEEGAPSDQLDLRLNFYTSFQDVRDFYKSGTVVDAARMLFSNQPSNAFPGAIQRLYVWKTNNTTRAERALEGPTNYGDLVAFAYGEDGNLIKTQVTDSQTEVKPTETFLYLPSPAARSYTIMVSGVQNAGLAVAADGAANDFVTAISGVSGLTTTGGTARTNLTGGTIDLTVAASGDTLTLNKSGGAGSFDITEIAVGDSAYIADGETLSGGSDENAGAYIVTSVTASSLALRQLKKVGAATEENVAAFDTSITPAVYDGLDLLINAPVTLTVTETTDTGSAATLEILEDSASDEAYDNWVQYSDFSNLLADSTSTIASITGTADNTPDPSELTITLDTGSWIQNPSVGDLVRISRGSLLAGATDKNVGFMVVTSANSQSITMSHLHAGMTTESVATVLLAGANDTIEFAPSFVSTSTAARRIDSASERKVKIAASRETDGATLQDNSIGGNVCFEMGYFQGADSSCTISISPLRIMTITPDTSSAITVNLKKYSTLSELATFLTTQTGLSAKASVAFQSLPTSVLDAVQGVDIFDGHAAPAYNGKLKKDYQDWANFYENDVTLLAFRAGPITAKSGLPDAEALPSFLSGGDIGWTTNSDIQDGLDAGLKVDVRQVVPLFSRDATKDIIDGLTDSRSAYTIDSINSACRAHVSTASADLFQKERFAVTSFDGSFENTKTKAQTLAFERVQMTFQRHSATGADGNASTFLPWMSACAIAAGRSQAILGTSMLRKPFLLNTAEHFGDVSLFTDTLQPDFEPEDRGELEEAIVAGLLVFRAVPGFGVRVESPDNTTRSRENDPKAWVFERANVLFTLDEIRDTIRITLENFIGSRQTDTPLSVVRQAINDVIGTFLANGSLIAGRVTNLTQVGQTYAAEVELRPVEAIEAITVDVLASRTLGDAA